MFPPSAPIRTKHQNSPVLRKIPCWILLLILASLAPTLLRASQPVSWPTAWEMTSVQDSSSAWWRVLRIQTVPGVRYHLQESTTLRQGEWTDLDSFHGNGGEWVCPLFPGHEPSEGTSSGTSIPDPANHTPLRQTMLVIEKTSAGDVLLSWKSLDDGSPVRTVVPGVTLDPIWDEFDSSYIFPHGGFFFGLCPRLHTPVNFSGTAPELGPIDSAMIADFTAALPDITANITHSVINAAYHASLPAASGVRAFYRVAADWSVDSDGDGRFDWQELILDGNNPYAADSDGDGQPDQASEFAGGSGTGGGYPEPTDAQGPTPLALIQQVTIGVRRDFAYYRDENRIAHIEVYPGWEEFIPDCAEIAWDQTLQEAAVGATTHSSLSGLVNGIPIPENAWWDDLRNFNGLNWVESFAAPHEVTTAGSFVACRSWFRLKLDAPAPAGGYRIPLRIGLVRQTIGPDMTGGYLAPSGNRSNFIEIQLECAEGQTIGTAVSIDAPADLPENEAITYIPACITTREPDIVPVVDDEVRYDLAHPGPVDPDGACVTTTGLFTVNFGNDRSIDIPYRTWTRPVVRWYKRKLLGNGTLDSNGDGSPKWARMTYDHDAKPYEGTRLALQSRYAGIYQLQARMVLPAGDEIEFPFVRLRDAKSIVDSGGTANLLLVAGQPDYFGVCTGQTAMNVRNTALPWLGATAYARDKNVPIKPFELMSPSTDRSPKCNIFVTHIANQAGAETPYYWRKKFGAIPLIAAPIAKYDWYQEPEANIDLDHPGWNYIGNASGNVGPSPGATCASPNVKGEHDTIDSRYGHVGILDYDGSWINAGSERVTKCLHLLDTQPFYKPNTFRTR